MYKNSHLHLLVSLKSYHGPILSLAKLKSWYELSNCELIWRIKCFRNLHRDRLEEQVPNRTLNLNFKGFEHFTYLERQRRIQWYFAIKIYKGQQKIIEACDNENISIFLQMALWYYVFQNPPLLLFVTHCFWNLLQPHQALKNTIMVVLVLTNLYWFHHRH